MVDEAIGWRSFFHPIFNFDPQQSTRIVFFNKIPAVHSWCTTLLLSEVLTNGSEEVFQLSAPTAIFVRTLKGNEEGIMLYVYQVMDD